MRNRSALESFLCNFSRCLSSRSRVVPTRVLYGAYFVAAVDNNQNFTKSGCVLGRIFLAYKHLNLFPARLSVDLARRNYVMRSYQRQWEVHVYKGISTN